jgi:hypothetical protein
MGNYENRFKAHLNPRIPSICQLLLYYQIDFNPNKLAYFKFSLMLTTKRAPLFITNHVFRRYLVNKQSVLFKLVWCKIENKCANAFIGATDKLKITSQILVEANTHIPIACLQQTHEWTQH